MGLDTGASVSRIRFFSDGAPMTWIPEQTADGSYTLRNTALDQACHSSEGAWQEARERYAVPTRLRERAPDSPVIGRAWLKTGSLRDVASIAGYVEGESGRRYSVVALINHPNAGAARPALDAVLDWTARDLPRASAAHAPSR